MDEEDEGQDRLTDLDVTWGLDLHAFLRERSLETSAAGDASDGIVETMGSCQEGTMDASSVPPGRVETVETMDSSQGGAVDASSVPSGRAESNSGASAASGTDQGNDEDPPRGPVGEGSSRAQ